METGGLPAVAVRNTVLTPKAIVYQKFGSKASYEIEEIQESAQNECPGLAITQKGPCLYRCSLQLPEIYVVSGIFKKKKEAEQNAAELALEKVSLILQHSTLNSSPFLIFNCPCALFENEEDLNLQCKEDLDCDSHCWINLLRNPFAAAWHQSYSK